MLRSTLFRIVVLFSMSAAALQAAAQEPSRASRSVRIITPIPSGAGPDALLRLVADELGRLWASPPVIVNQPGAAGMIAARAAHAAKPDGGTLFMALASTYVSLPTLEPDLPFDMTEFVPVGLIGEVPMFIAAAPDLPVDSLADLIAYSKTRPDGVTVASAATPGEMPVLTFELLKERSGGRFTPVLYTNPGAAVTDVISGRVNAIIDGLAGPAGRSQGQVKALAVASQKRLPSRPDLPTVAETLPGFSASGWWLLVAPPRTPDSVADRIGDDLRAVLSRSEIRAKFQSFGAVTRDLTRPELAAFIRAEQDLWSPVVRAGVAKTRDDGPRSNNGR
jgi:tripartite-type tricarboxylate transporter receptor subunit TctC